MCEALRGELIFSWGDEANTRYSQAVWREAVSTVDGALAGSEEFWVCLLVLAFHLEVPLWASHLTSPVLLL